MSAVSVVAAVAAWVVVLTRARASWRGPASLARRPLWVTALALAVAWTVRIDRVFADLDRVSGVPNLAQLLGDVAGLVTGAAILTVLVAQRETAVAAARAARRLWLGLGALAAATVTAFLVAGFTVETRQFTVAFAAQPRYWAYEVPYLAAFVLIFGGLAVWAGRYARAASSRTLTAGMTATAAGGALGLVYVACRVVFTVGAVAGAQGWERWYAPVSAGTAAGASLLALGGAFLPSLAPHLQRRRLYGARADLLPLWQALRSAGLMEALIEPDSPDGRRDPAFTVRRLVVEIDDGLLQLRPWLTRPAGWDHTSGAATAGPDPHQPAQLAALDIAAAVRNRAQGAPPTVGAPATGPAAGPADSSPDAETRWLRTVSRAYADLPTATHPVAPAAAAVDDGSDPRVRAA